MVARLHSDDTFTGASPDLGALERGCPLWRTAVRT